MWKSASGAMQRDKGCRKRKRRAGTDGTEGEKDGQAVRKVVGKGQKEWHNGEEEEARGEEQLSAEGEGDGNEAREGVGRRRAVSWGTRSVKGRSRRGTGVE
jgi:hypothetical protein